MKDGQGWCQISKYFKKEANGFREGVELLQAFAGTNMDAPNINYFVAGMLVEELVRLGVRRVGIAPGSRSSPLAETIAEHGGLDFTVHPDERGLGFFVLGAAKATGRPSAVITTSGTAAVNLFPAVAEAQHAGVPLLLLTADRPDELRACGANQATDQVKLFGGFVKEFFDVPPPDDRVEPGFYLSVIDQAVRAASEHPPGPVHLNVRFREPLAPAPEPYERRKLMRRLGKWLSSGRPWSEPLATKPRAVERPDGLGASLSRAKIGIVLVGRIAPDAAKPIAELADRLGWPLLPDLQSGLRFGASGEPAVIPHADLLLGAEPFLREAGRGALLQFGANFVTRRFLDLAAGRGFAERIVVDPAAGRVEPSHGPHRRVVGDPSQVARMLLESVAPSAARERLSRWRAASDRVERTLARRFRGPRLSEPAVAWRLSRLIPPTDGWFIGNSLPVRLAATFGSGEGGCVRVAANRGLSGIDGLVATAAGYADGLGRPVTALVGDLSLLHDLNSLALLNAARAPVVVVVLNNDGGGIFSLLPIAGTSRHFEKVFAAPHGCTFRAAADLFGLWYAAPEDLASFEASWRAAANTGEPALIEVRTHREATAREIRRLVQSAGRTARP